MYTQCTRNEHRTCIQWTHSERAMNPQCTHNVNTMHHYYLYMIRVNVGFIDLHQTWPGKSPRAEDLTWQFHSTPPGVLITTALYHVWVSTLTWAPSLHHPSHLAALCLLSDIISFNLFFFWLLMVLLVLSAFVTALSSSLPLTDCSVRAVWRAERRGWGWLLPHPDLCNTLMSGLTHTLTHTYQHRFIVISPPLPPLNAPETETPSANAWSSLAHLLTQRMLHHDHFIN